MFSQIIVLLVVAFILVSLYKEWLRPIPTFLIGVVILSVFKVLSAKDLLTGFANEQIAVIILLLIISSIIQRTTVMDLLFGKIFQSANNYKSFLSRMMIYISSSSAFFNNTPLVAMMMPYVFTWCKKHNVSPSKLLIPLSYASILGGSATLIGTSTNLLVNGMAMENGIDTINIFDFSYVGVPMIIIGFLYVYFIGHKLLPDHQNVVSQFTENAREFLVETVVNKDSHLVGKSVEDANLRNLKGLFLVEIVRRNYRISPVAPNRTLQANDKLIFAGETDQVIELIKPKIGLSIPESHSITSQERNDIVEVVISPNSQLVRKKVRYSNFRGRYDAAIIAVNRNGEKLHGKIGDIVLQAGDVLLLLTGKDFANKRESNDFYFISKVKEIYNIRPRDRIILMGGLVLAILLSALKIISLFKALLVLLTAIIVFKIASPSQLRRAIDFNLIAIAGLALGIGKAILDSGTAEFLANGIISAMAFFGPMGMIAGIFIVTSLLASYITYIAAISIVFPISFELGNQLLASGQINSIIPFILVVAYGASANFITPIGYLTNIMVYGPGNYNFKDFFKIGFPLLVTHMTVTILILSAIYGL